MREANTPKLLGRARFVMEDGLDVDIIKYLAAEDKIYSKEKMEHNYPHCWRCGTPLVYYAKPSWYIEMTKLKDRTGGQQQYRKLVSLIIVGEKRFGNWLAEVKDWAISRSRYWGHSDSDLEMRMRSSGMYRFQSGAGGKSTWRASDEIIELHRPYVDDVHLDLSGMRQTDDTEFRRSWTAGLTPVPCRSRSGIIRLNTQKTSMRSSSRQTSSARESTRPEAGSIR